MRTHNQLHHYTIISMKVTIFSAVKQTLQCFHITLRENDRSLANSFERRFSRPIFLENFYRTRDRTYSFKSYFHNPPLADINSATNETFCVQLRRRTTCTCTCTVHVHVYM